MVITSTIKRDFYYLGESAAANIINEEIIILSGSGVCDPGLVLGQLEVGTQGVAAAAKSGGNTGNGTIGTPTADVNATEGAYLVRVTGGAFDASIAAQAAGNVGNGTAAMEATETAAGVVAGVYKAVFTGVATDGGAFLVEDPNGVIIGEGVVGTAFDGVVKFTISDGATDFGENDTFLITVVAIVPTNGLGAFSVTKPDGSSDGTGTIGTAYNGSVNFTLADGVTNFIVGDGFDVTVSYGAVSDKYAPHDPAGTDGRQTAVAILGAGVDATSADVTAVATVRGPATIFGTCLTYKSGISAGDKAAAIQALRNKGLAIIPQHAA